MPGHIVPAPRRATSWRRPVIRYIAPRCRQIPCDIQPDAGAGRPVDQVRVFL